MLRARLATGAWSTVARRGARTPRTPSSDDVVAGPDDEHTRVTSCPRAARRRDTWAKTRSTPPTRSAPRAASAGLGSNGETRVSRTRGLRSARGVGFGGHDGRTTGWPGRAAAVSPEA